MNVLENKDQPLVAIYMITYNHERYIGQAIEGVLIQKANFKIKLFIGEDCSTDNTRAICQDYAKKYPDLIELICTKENNIIVNSTNVRNACIESGAKYIAFCEGDDYWTDPIKLQKQVDFLEANSDFSVCFSGVTIVDEIGEQLDDKYPRKEGDVYTIEDVILTTRNIVPTPTKIFRSILPNPLPDFYINGYLSGDICLQLLLADKGKMKYLPEKMAAYRNHQGGITKIEKYAIASAENLFNILVDANDYFGFKYDKLFRKRLLEISRGNLIYGSKSFTGKERLKHIYKQFRRYLHYSEHVDIKEIAYYFAILFFPGILKKMKKV